MRVRKKDQKNIFRVGVFVTFLTAVIMVMIVSIGKENSIFDKKTDIRARVANVSALKTGSYVELKGIRIGSVSAIKIISEEEVEITMSVLEKDLKWIKQDSRVSISTAGLVGDKYVEIYKGTKDAAPFRPSEDVLVSEDLSDIKKILSKGETIAGVTERILLKIDNMLTNLEHGDRIVHTVDSLYRSSTNLERITADLQKAKLGETVKSVNMSMEKLDRILARVEKGPGTMNSLIYDDGVHDDLRAVLGGASRNKVIKYFIRESIKNSEKKVP